MIFFSFKAPKPALCPSHPPNQWLYGLLYPELRRPEREFYHLPPRSAKVKNEGSYTSAPLVCLRDLDLNIFMFYLFCRGHLQFLGDSRIN